MRPKLSLEDPAVVVALVERLDRLTPGSRRAWGRLTPNEMLCHLTDSFHAVLNERATSGNYSNVLSRTVIKYLAIHTTWPWPQGVPTPPELDPKIAGTRPEVFEQDRAATLVMLKRFIRPETRFGQHPAFGEMTREEWMLWGFGHVDHHLRQFGL